MSNSNPFGGISATNPFSQPTTPTVNTSYGVIPNGTPNVDDLFGSLLEFRWRGIPFPVVEFDTEFVHGQVVHKFADRDSAHVEPTGRMPLRITARIPLINYITPAKSETWTPRQLYPGTWRALFTACANRKSDKLQHPELGTLICKCENHRTTWKSDVRGGVFTSISWIESDDTANDLTSALSSPSPAASVFASAAAIDAALASVSPIVVPQPYVPTISFSDLANAVRGVVDQGTLLQKEFAGRIANLIYEANALESSLRMAENALNWPFFQMAEELKASCYALQKQLLTDTTRAILFYTVVKDSTLAQVANSLSAPVDDIMSLNPTYVSLGIIPQGAIVRYYAAV